MQMADEAARRVSNTSPAPLAAYDICAQRQKCEDMRCREN